MSLKALQTEHLAVQMSIERRVRGLVGLMFECVSQATPPPPKNVFVCCYGNCPCVGGSWCHCECASEEKEGEWGEGEKAGTAETFLSHRKWNKLCTHCSWPNTDELIHTLIYIHTFSQNCGLLSICSPKSASMFLPLSTFISMYFYLFLSLYCSIIGTIWHQNFFAKAGLCVKPCTCLRWKHACVKFDEELQYSLGMQVCNTFSKSQNWQVH